MTTSYQRRKAEIAYLTYRGRQLEEIIAAMGRAMKAGGLQPFVPITGSIDGDDPITDITSGDLAMQMMSRKDWN
jgi:hypothetical protein